MISILHHARLPALASLAGLLLVSCASKDELELPGEPLALAPEAQEPAYIPTYSTTVLKGWPKGRSLDPHDRSRVRLGEEVHAYHLGRLPSEDRRDMHEAHTVYRVEQDARWDTRLPATPMDSRGVVLGIIEPSRADVPKSEIIEQERQSLIAKSIAMQKTMAQLTVLQGELEKKRRDFAQTEKDALNTKVYLEEVRQKLAENEAALLKAGERIRELEDNEKLRLKSSPQGFGTKRK